MPVDDGGERGGQIGIGLDGIEFAGLDQRRDGRPVFGTGIVPGEEGVFAVQATGRIVRPAALLSGMLLSVPLVLRAILARRKGGRAQSSAASPAFRRFQRIDDHNATPMKPAPKRPVITSGICVRV